MTYTVWIAICNKNSGQSIWDWNDAFNYFTGIVWSICWSDVDDYVLGLWFVAICCGLTCRLIYAYPGVIELDGDIGQGNGLVPSGTMPLPEPMLTITRMQVMQLWRIWVHHSYTSIENYDHNNTKDKTVASSMSFGFHGFRQQYIIWYYLCEYEINQFEFCYHHFFEK